MIVRSSPFSVVRSLAAAGLRALAAAGSFALVAVAACSSSTAPLAGDVGDASSSDDASSSNGSSGGSSSGSSGASSGGSSSGSSSGPSSGDAASDHPVDAGVCGMQVASGVTFTDGGIECGSSCDLQKNTCCVNSVGIASCASGHSGCGGGLSASFECVQDTDCPSGQVCCGYAMSGEAGSKCQDISGNGNKCSPTPSSTQGSVQFCQKTCECKDGSECIPQSCEVATGVPAANLTMCGLQSSPPYNCKPR